MLFVNLALCPVLRKFCFIYFNITIFIQLYTQTIFLQMSSQKDIPSMDLSIAKVYKISEKDISNLILF